MNFFLVMRVDSNPDERGYQMRLYVPRKIIDTICYCNLIVRDQYNEAVYI